MARITNAKIGFGRYSGFSLLFDNPGQNSLSSMGTRFQKIDCRVDTDPSLEFYRVLKETLNEIDLEHLFDKYLFFALPPSSYHVTVADGLNQEDVDKLGQANKPLLDDFLTELPVALHQGNPFMPVFQNSALLGPQWDITFVFNKLTNWRNEILVARLKTVDADSKNTLSMIKEARSLLYADLFDRFKLGKNLRFGVSGSFSGELDKGTVSPVLKACFLKEKFELVGKVAVTIVKKGEKWSFKDEDNAYKKEDKKYVATRHGDDIVICKQKKFYPHVSLGYFGNQQKGEAAKRENGRWTEVFKRHMENKTISFTSINLYGFIDMATYFKG